MADEKITKEKVIITFEDNAKETSKDVQGLRASIDQTTDATEQNAKEVDKQEQAYKSLKTQLREAVIEQQKLSAQYGATSAEAIKATKAVAGIKDEIEFQKDLVKSYNPDEKFRGLSQTAGVAAIALSGVKDGFTALGIESKVLDQVIGSAQAILGVTSAVSGLSDAYAILNTSKKATSVANITEVATTEAVAVAEAEATTATWSFNAALLANPIVAITAGIVAAIAVIYAYVKITGDAAKAEEKAKVSALQLTVAIDNQARSFENNSKYLAELNNHKIALLRASGASEKQIYSETKALAEQELQLAKNFRSQAILAEQKAYEANRDNPTEFNAETLKKAKENIEKAQQAVTAGYDGLIALQNDHEVAIEQARTDARNKALEAQKQAYEKELEERKKAHEKLIEEEKAFRKILRDTAFSERELEISSERDNIQRQSDEITKSEEEATNKQIEKEKSNNDFFAEESDRRIANEKDIADKRLAQKEAEQTALSDLGNAGINAAKDLFGKNKAVQKGIIATDGAVALGKVAINTVEAVAKDNAASPLTFGLPWSAVHIATGALGAASIIANTSKALQAVGGGSAPTAGATPRASVGSAPQVGFQASSENQIATSINTAQANVIPQKAYVVGSEVTTQQNLDAKLIKENSFG